MNQRPFILILKDKEWSTALAYRKKLGCCLLIVLVIPRYYDLKEHTVSCVTRIFEENLGSLLFGFVRFIPLSVRAVIT